MKILFIFALIAITLSKRVKKTELCTTITNPGERNIRWTKVKGTFKAENEGKWTNSKEIKICSDDSEVDFRIDAVYSKTDSKEVKEGDYITTECHGEYRGESNMIDKFSCKTNYAKCFKLSAPGVGKWKVEVNKDSSCK